MESREGYSYDESLEHMIENGEKMVFPPDARTQIAELADKGIFLSIENPDLEAVLNAREDGGFEVHQPKREEKPKPKRNSYVAVVGTGLTTAVMAMEILRRTHSTPIIICPKPERPAFVRDVEDLRAQPKYLDIETGGMNGKPKMLIICDSLTGVRDDNGDIIGEVVSHPSPLAEIHDKVYSLEKLGHDHLYKYSHVDEPDPLPGDFLNKRGRRKGKSPKPYSTRPR